MASNGTGLRRLLITLRRAYNAWSTPAGNTSATARPVRWLGTTCAVRANQKFDIWVRISPLPGIGSGRTTSNALRRSLATISSSSSDSA